MYFIHANMDHIIPLDEAKLMYKECGSSSKELFTAEGANHNNITMILGDTYFEKIKEFIDND